MIGLKRRRSSRADFRDEVPPKRPAALFNQISLLSADLGKSPP